MTIIKADLEILLTNEIGYKKELIKEQGRTLITELLREMDELTKYEFNQLPPSTICFLTQIIRLNSELNSLLTLKDINNNQQR